MKTSVLFICIAGIIFSHVCIAQVVTPQEQDGKYSFSFANIYFEVDPSFGARISSFQIDGTEILTQSAGVGDYLWGSTLWQSPQNEWNWPPSTELDQQAYSGGISGTRIDLRSNIDETYSNLVFNKQFIASLSDTSVTIKYTLINKGTDAHSFSAWEVARVPSGGISFFPIGEGDVEGAFATETELINDIVWYEQDDSDPSGQKFFCDGAEGWSAHVTNNSHVFIKKYEDAAASANAPGEKEVELYYAGAGSYIELENQSAYTEIAVNDSISWTVKWFLRNLPASIEAQTGDMELANYVRNIIQNSPVPIIENALAPKISFYPNPASGSVTIRNRSAGSAVIRISDINGRVVFETEIENNGRIQREGIQTGLYFYQISGLIYRDSGKLIIIE